MLFFGGIGKRISDINKMAYPGNVCVKWKWKAWADEIFCREWAMDNLKIVSYQYHLNRETDKHDCLLLFNDHLCGQMPEDYKYAFK